MLPEPSVGDYMRTTAEQRTAPSQNVFRRPDCVKLPKAVARLQCAAIPLIT